MIPRTSAASRIATGIGNASNQAKNSSRRCCKIAVFASGRGSNFKAILEAIEAGTIRNAEIVLVVSNNPGAGALETARERKIPAIHMSRRQFETDGSFCAAVLEVLEKHGVTFIVLAGYMKMIDAEIVRRFRNRIVNIHPALLPAFGGPGMYGAHVHEAVIKSRALTSGATVHIVYSRPDAPAGGLRVRMGRGTAGRCCVGWEGGRERWHLAKAGRQGRQGRFLLHQFAPGGTVFGRHGLPALGVAEELIAFLG